MLVFFCMKKRLEKQGMETCQMLERKIKEQQEIVQKKRIDLEQHTTEMERVENRIKTMRHQISELDKDIRNLKVISRFILCS